MAKLERTLSGDFNQLIKKIETDVNYMFQQGGYAGGLTPLLDREGKPIISPIINK